MNKLLANKPVLIGLIAIILVILIAIFSKGGQDLPQTSSSMESTETKSGFQITSLTDPKKKQAIEYRELISDRLPVRIAKFKTSTGIETNIDVTHIPQDPDEVVNLAITGLSYLDTGVESAKNPNAIAYKESYQEAMRRMKEIGIDTTRLIITYGDRDYVQRMANKWIQDFDLHQ